MYKEDVRARRTSGGPGRQRVTGLWCCSPGKAAAPRIPKTRSPRTSGGRGRDSRQRCAHATGTLGPQGQTPTHALPRRPLFLFAPGKSQQRPSRSHPLQLWRRSRARLPSPARELRTHEGQKLRNHRAPASRSERRTVRSEDDTSLPKDLGSSGQTWESLGRGPTWHVGRGGSRQCWTHQAP